MEFSVSLEGTSAVIFLVVMAVLILVTIISKWKIFNKANRPGWASIIPIYSDIILFEIADINILKVILLFIPIANIIMAFSAYIKLSKKFGKGTGLGILMVLVPIIGLPILAFGKSEYESDSNSSEDTSSILDVNMSGVPNSSEEPEFKYGYEKESTVVMDPVNPNNVQSNEINVNSEVSNAEPNPVNNITPETLNVQNTDINVPVDNVNIDDINIPQTEGVLNASTESVNINPVEEIPSQNVVNEEKIVEPEPINNIPAQPLENSALDAQLNQQVNENPQNDIPEQSIIEDTNNIQPNQSVDIPIENSIDQSIDNTETISSDDEDFTEIS